MELVGNTIGRFRIVELIGRGGMGEVYSGFDEKLNRQVALKAIRQSYRLDMQNRARFLREARILSQLDHPFICRIFDYIEGDTADFLVLEFIDGKNLRVALQAGLDESVKMKIARQIADALVAAHAKSIVHRDLKPGNVMLTRDGDVKILDFGLARAMGEIKTQQDDGIEVFQPAQSASQDDIPSDEYPTELQTQQGMVVGTAAFMSPEQARGEEATSASDMYSLGLLLQELFTGEPPYPPDVSGIQLLYRVSRGETLPVTGIDSDLAGLIERLKSPTVTTRPSALDTVDRLIWIGNKPKRKLRRRLRAAFTMSLAIVAAVMSVLVVRVSQEVKRANREAETSRQVSRFLVDMFEVSDPFFGRGETITAREILDRGLSKIRHELKDQPIQRARLMDTIGVVYRELGLYEKAEPILEEALDIRKTQLGSRHIEVSESLNSLAEFHAELGRYESAEDLYTEALDIQKNRLGEDHWQVSVTLSHLATLYAQQRRNSEAESLYRQSLAILEEGHGDDVDIARVKGGLGSLYGDQGRYEEAEPLLRVAMETYQNVFEPDDPRVASVVYNLAAVLQQLGRFADAKPMFKTAAEHIEASFGPNHPKLGVVLNSYAALCYGLEDYDRAETLYRRALDIFESSLGDDHAHVAMVLNNLAEVCRARRSFQEAIEYSKRSIAIKEDALGPDHPRVAQSLRGLADACLALGDVDTAEAHLSRSASIWEKAGETDNPEFGKCLASLARVRQEEGADAKARTLFQRALDIMRAGLDPDHPELRALTRDYEALLQTIEDNSPAPKPKTKQD